MITCRRGDVVVVEIPFTDRTACKRRPALVVSAEPFHRALPDVIVCPISSQPRYYQRPGPGDHPLRQWQAVGLHYPSTARVSGLLAVEKTLIRRRLGALAAEDLDGVSKILRRALEL